MRNIIIVEAFSTGVNYITDITHRGYNPVVLEPAINEESLVRERKSTYERTKDKFEIIEEENSYEKTLALVKTYNPALIVAGSEAGVELATRLASDCGLPGNNINNIPKMTQKPAMHEALKEAGIRYIKGKVVDSSKDAILFCKENNLTSAVVKPVQSAGSNGLYLCDNLEEVKNAVDELLTMTDLFGKAITSVIIQERIVGTEYIVNTMSSAGKHRLSSFFRYRKVKTTEGGYIYDNTESIFNLEPGHTALIEYAFKVADAIGLEYGPIHGEYMIDENGPVLIEVNCRPMGLTLPAEFMDLIYGQHETDSALDGYLAPEKFAAEASKPYRCLRQGYIKTIKVPKDLEAESLPIWIIAKNLRSTYLVDIAEPMSVHEFVKTRDLHTAGGLIYMVHDDKNIVDHDLKLLTYIEENYFSYIFNDGMSRKWFVDKSSRNNSIDTKELLSKAGSTLIVADSDNTIKADGALIVTPDKISDVTAGFDQVILMFNEWIPTVNEVICLERIFDIMKKVKIGGRVIITEKTWKYLTYKRDGAELLLSILGYRIEAPLPGQENMVIGSRE